jgi:hypothetical protein
MVSPGVGLLGLLVPVLVIPLGLLALKVLGIVAIFMVVELARIPVLYSLSVAAVSFVALCRVVDGFLLRRRVVDVVLRVFWVRVLAVVAPVALWRSGGLSLAAGWRAAASASALMLWADLRRSFGRAADGVWVWLVARAWLDVGRLLWAVGETCDALRGWCSCWFLSSGGSALWLFFSGAALGPRSGLQLRTCERWRGGGSRYWMAVGTIILCMLPGSEAVGGISELAADLLWTAPGWYLLRLLVPEGADPQLLDLLGFCCLAVRLYQWSGLSALAVRLRQWSPTQQAHTQRGAAQQQTAVAQEQAALLVEQTAVAAEEQAAVAIAVVSSAGALHNTARARQWVSGQGWLSVAAVAVRETTEAMTASEEGQVQVAEVTHCLRSMFREQEEEAATVAGEAVPLPQRTRDRATGAAEADTVVAAGAQAETVVGEAAAPTEAEGAAAALKRSRRRHRVRRRANGAPRSCVLENGRWINLPRARQAAADTIAVVQVRKQRRKQQCKQQRCRFNDGSSGCKRSQCRFAPTGHAPAVDGPDVLDPLVAAKLESLVGLMQAGLGRQQQEQLHQLQLQSQSAAAVATAVAEIQAVVAAKVRQIQLQQQRSTAQLQLQVDQLGQQQQQQNQQQKFRLAAVEEQIEQQQQTESSLWDFLDPLVEQVQKQQQAQHQQQQQLQEHTQRLEWQGQVAEEQPWQTTDKLRHTELMEQIKSGCERVQSDHLDNSVSNLSSEIHRLKQSATLSTCFELEMRNVIEDIGRLKATFARRGIALAVPPDCLSARYLVV